MSPEENAVGAEEEFHAAFQTDFDYLLNDMVPFFVALKATMDEDVGSYEPPRVVRYRVPPPIGDGFEAPVRIRRICGPHRPSRKGDRRPNRSAILGNDTADDALARPCHLRARELERDPNPRRRVTGHANGRTVDQHSVGGIQHSEAHAVPNR